MLSQLHIDFLSVATSAVSIDNDVLTGRPYGGKGILYKHSLSHAITVLDVKESQMTAILVHTIRGSVLLVNVYMPTDYGNLECSENYLDMCAKKVCYTVSLMLLVYWLWVTLIASIMYHPDFMIVCYNLLVIIN